MPCNFRHSDGYQCDFAFPDDQLEGKRCPLHFDHRRGGALVAERTALVQAALDQLLEKRIASNAPVSLVGVSVPIGVAFGARRLPALFVRDSEFGGGNHFSDVTILGAAEFKDTKFHGTAGFSRSRFEGGLTFHASVHGVDFSNSVFSKKTSIRPTFNGDRLLIGFDGIFCDSEFSFVLGQEVRSDFNFSRGEFRDRFLLQGVFRGRVDFSKSKFVRKAEFLGKFLGNFSARNCEFSEDVSFQKVTFGSGLDFGETVFNASANFQTSIAGQVRLDGCLFKGVANFSSVGDAEILEVVNFSGAEFLSVALFTNRRFQSTANFEKCTFHFAPEFHGTSLHQDTRFPRIEAFCQIHGENAAAAYRTLRQAMEKNNARREEAMFYALEQKTLRNIPGAQSFWENLASGFYDAVSEYGVNFWRPLGWVIFFSCIFGLGYGLWQSNTISVHAEVDWDLVGNGLTFSLQQVVNPFWVWRVDDERLWSPFPNAIRLVATIEALVTTGLLALALLALRWRFKRD